MSYPATAFRVMIASPSDVTTERNLIREVCAEWNAIHSKTRKIVLLPVGWETHSTPSSGEHPQATINKQVLEDCDLLVGVFWTKIGTPTKDYASGSIEEIEEHIKAGKQAMLYFSTAPVELGSVPPEQYNELKKFRDSCKERALYQTYESTSDFKEKFSRQLQLKLNEETYFTKDSPATNMSPAVPEKTATRSTPSLSAEARSLLTEAIKDQSGMVYDRAYIGGHSVQTNGKEFLSDESPRTLAVWLDAIQELTNSRSLDRLNESRYRVTKDGYDLAELLGLRQQIGIG